MLLVHFSYINYNIFLLPTCRRLFPQFFRKKEDTYKNLNCMLISTVPVCWCVCEVLQGNGKTNYWQSLGNSYPINRALSHTALWENHTPTSRQQEEKNIFALHYLNEFSPRYASLCLMKIELKRKKCSSLPRLRDSNTHRDIKQKGEGVLE